jgi:hypothetical protein
MSHFVSIFLEKRCEGLFRHGNTTARDPFGYPLQDFAKARKARIALSAKRWTVTREARREQDDKGMADEQETPVTAVAWPGGVAPKSPRYLLP